MLTHKECNPEMVGKNSNQGGLRLHGWKVQMGLSQSDLRPLPESIQAVQSADSRRVLSGLRLQPQIRHSITQRPSTTIHDRRHLGRLRRRHRRRLLPRPPDANTYVSNTFDGEVILAPTVGAEFDGLPSGWTSTPWATGGTSTVAGGNVVVDGARAATDLYYAADRSIEFYGTFSAGTFQHVGFGQLLASVAGESWAMFGTYNTSNILYARTNNNGATIDNPITELGSGRPTASGSTGLPPA